MENYDLSRERILLEDLLQNAPPYSKRQIDYGQYNYFANLTNISIDSYCENCCCKKSFIGNISNEISELRNILIKNLSLPDCLADPLDEIFKGKYFYFTFILKCAKCGSEHIYVLRLDGDIIMKVGQYPSYVSNEIREMKKYKNLISKYYVEFTKSISCYSQGNGVAAFVYLRRILEWLIDSKYHGESGLKFIERLKKVEESELIIPTELCPVKGEIYSILSKGVHEYCEEECLILYPSVKFVIERILDQELEKKANERKAKEAIRVIHAKL